MILKKTCGGMTTGSDQSPNLDPLKIDALREVGSVGAMHASNSLSSLMEADVMVNVSECTICRTEELPYSFGDPTKTVASIYLEVISEGTGSMLIMFPLDMAKDIAALMLGDYTPERPHALDEMELQALSEIGNICASSYINALSSFMEVTMMPSPPGVAVGMMGAILQYPAQLAAENYDYVVVVTTRFQMGEREFPAFIMYLPDQDSTDKLMKSMGIE